MHAFFPKFLAGLLLTLGTSMPIRAATEASEAEFLAKTEQAYLASEEQPRAMRQAMLALWQNHLDTARALAKAEWDRDSTNKTAAAILAEANYRAGDFAQASTWFRAADKAQKADMTALFGARVPYARDMAQAIELPFVHTDPLPMIVATIADENINLVIDTGAAELTLSPEVAARAGVELALSQAQGTFAGGKQAPVSAGRLPAISLGGVLIRDIPVQVLDTSKFSAAANGLTVHGVVGTTFLRQFRSTLDYRQGELLLRPRKSEGNRSGTPFWMLGDHYIVAAGRVNNALGLYFIDTGAAGMGLALPAKTLEEAHIVTDASKSTTGVGGGGNISITPFVASSVRLGDDSATNVPGVAGAFPAVLETVFGVRLHGLISHAYFRQSALTFDFDSMRLIMER